jgi:hypothetical protein
MKDYCIVGAGPAGIFAALHLARAGKSVIIIDKGNPIDKRICHKGSENSECKCNPCNILSGFGGAGGKSDGKLIFSAQSGCDLYEYADEKTINECISEVKRQFIEWSGVTPIVESSQAKETLAYNCLKYGMKLTTFNEMHIGSDKMVNTMKNAEEELKSLGVTMLFNNNSLCTQTREFAKKTVYAVGRCGFKTIDYAICDNLVTGTHRPIDMGIRLETLDEITKPLTDIQYCFKISSQYGDYNVRSYCVNPLGFVVNERHDGFNLVNGHACANKKSKNCNFAILVKMALTKPCSNTTEYAKGIAKLFDILGGGSPIVQRLEDFRNRKRTNTYRLNLSNVKRTFKNCIPGDIHLGFHHPITSAIEDYLSRLDHLAPGINDGNNTLLYGPEIKFQALKLDVDKNFESKIAKGYYFIGDGAGLSGSIVSAAVTGMLMAKAATT